MRVCCMQKRGQSEGERVEKHLRRGATGPLSECLQRCMKGQETANFLACLLRAVLVKNRKSTLIHCCHWLTEMHLQCVHAVL